jgi:prepilin-type N-terminal cleavage/methylation domain-containing protein
MMSSLRRRAASDRGFTLIEMLVSMIIMGLVGTVVMSVVFGARTASTASVSQHDLNEEARQALNRMAREVRQATAITAVQNPDGAAYDGTKITSMTFTADFDGDGCIDGVAPTPTPTPAPTCSPSSSSNPETLTYCWDPSVAVRQLYLVPGAVGSNTCSASGARPILAGQVTSFQLAYRSNSYLYDANSDGVTAWSELDGAVAPVGDSNDVLDANELKSVDSVVLTLTVSAGGAHTQNYQTQVDLRNLS